MSEVLLTMMVTAIGCAILGPILVLRKLAMTADALSHSVLLGIVVAFFFVPDLRSIWLVISASIFGVFTVWLVEELSRHRLVERDDALAIVFPIFFALAVLLITKFFRNTHLDVEVVLMGNPLFTPFIRQFGMPKSMFEMLVILAMNGIFLLFNYQKLKVAIFDPEYAQLIGIPVTYLYRVLMILVSVTCVVAFNSVGGILVISYFVAPAAAACMITKDLKITILVSILFAIINSWLGYHIAILWNVSVSGMCSLVGMVTVLLGIVFHRHGMLRQWAKSFVNHEKFCEDLLLVHLYRHQGNTIELGYQTIHKHLNWSSKITDERIERLIKRTYVMRDDIHQLYSLTEKGMTYVTKQLLQS